MKTSTLFTCFTALVFSSLSTIVAQEATMTDAIVTNASADNIDLTVLDFLDDVLAEITTVYDAASQAARKRNVGSVMSRGTPATVIDAHTHVVPDWYKALVPTTGGNPTPAWDITSYLAFMKTQGIKRSIFSFSAPGAGVYPGQKGMTVALARLMNEQAAAYCRAYPNKFSFYAVVPLPYTQEAIIEAQYALSQLGAVGIFLQSNFDGKYLGHVQFKPFFNAINKLPGKQIIYVHPSTPYIAVGNNLVEANPTPYPTGNIEFYFETSRTLMDLTLTQTIHNFTNINYIIPHVGGAFPATIDRIIKSVPAIYNSSMLIYQTRFWWDSAGPTFFHQISGLLGYDIPKTRLLFGTDFPYAPSFTQVGSLAAVKNTLLLTAAEKTQLLTTNAAALFGSRISA